MYQTTHPTYLVHFNKNHDSKNGQFTYGDGDGDGINNDHKNQRNDPRYTRSGKKKFELNPPGRAKSGESEGFHRAKNFLDYPYYIDEDGNKHYYNTIFDLPKGEKGRAFVQNLGKMLLLPIEFGYAIGTLAKDARDQKKYKQGN